MSRLLTPKRVALLAVPAVLIAVGIAIGAWNATGSGTGYAKAGTSSSLTLGDASASTVADLYPGVTNGNVKITVTNPNSFPVSITTVSQTASTSITSDKGGLSAAARRARKAKSARHPTILPKRIEHASWSLGNAIGRLQSYRIMTNKSRGCS